MHSSTNALNRQVCAFISPRRFELCSSNTATKPEKSCTKSTDAPLTCLPLRFPGIAGPWGACYSTSADGSTPTLRLTVRFFSRSCTCACQKTILQKQDSHLSVVCIKARSDSSLLGSLHGTVLCFDLISPFSPPALARSRGTADCTPGSRHSSPCRSRPSCRSSARCG